MPSQRKAKFEEKGKMERLIISGLRNPFPTLWSIGVPINRKDNKENIGVVPILLQH